MSPLVHAIRPLDADVSATFAVRAWVSRATTWIAGAAALGGSAAAQGGYFPTAWGWMSIAFLWVAALALLLRGQLASGPAEACLLVGLFALTGWSALSLAWSSSPGAAIDEVQRTLVYLSGALAVLVATGPRRVEELLGGALGGIGAISAYALTTRLFPERFGTIDISSQDRLFAPIGYANALGAFAAIGLLLAIGFAVRGRSRGTRCGAAALVPVIAATQYFTFSRGADIALVCGIAVAIAVDSRRLALVTGLLGLAVPAGVAVWLGASSAAMTHASSRLSAAAAAGHRLAVAIVMLSAISAGLTYVFTSRRASRIRFGPTVRRVYGRALLTALAAGVAAVFTVYGTPPTLAQEAWNAFRAPPAATTNLNQHLLSLSGAGRVDAWSVALQDFEGHPLLGSGAGSYEQYWNAHRPTGAYLRDAHSLYLETLAELGVVGLALLLVVLLTPLAAARRAASHPVGPIVLGAYVVYLVHAAVDWDWEMPAVTLAGLFVGLALLLVVRREGHAPPLRLSARAAAIAAILGAGAFAIVGLLGYTAASESATALAQGDYKQAEADARQAARWQPWSPRPWQLIAAVRYQRGDLVGAAHYYRLALQRDPDSWELWTDLGFALEGNEANRAFARAYSLNPRSLEIPTAAS